MLEKKSKMKTRKDVSNKIKGNKDNEKILIVNTDESGEMSLDEKCQEKHTILDLLNKNYKCKCIF